MRCRVSDAVPVVTQTLNQVQTQVFARQSRYYDCTSDCVARRSRQGNKHLCDARKGLRFTVLDLRTKFVDTGQEWYGWHFPEMSKILSENLAYAKVVKLMGEY